MKKDTEAERRKMVRDQAKVLEKEGEMGKSFSLSFYVCVCVCLHLYVFFISL